LSNILGSVHVAPKTQNPKTPKTVHFILFYWKIQICMGRMSQNGKGIAGGCFSPLWKGSSILGLNLN